MDAFTGSRHYLKLRYPRMIRQTETKAPLDLLKRKFSILHEISSAIVFTDNIGSIANLMLDLALSYTDAEKGSLLMLDGGNVMRVLAARGMDMLSFQDYRVRLGEGISGKVAKDRTPVLVENIDMDERFSRCKRDRYKTKSFISCPLISRNKLLGVFNINDKKDGSPFNNDEFDLLKIISNHAAIALENALLLNELRTKADQLDELNNKLIDSDIHKTEFITRVSHELRNPLNSIKGAIYYLSNADSITQQDRREFYDIISTETNRVVERVENLIDFLGLEDESRILKKSILTPSDLFQDVANAPSIKTLLMRNNIRFQYESQDRTSDIIGDRVKIVQLFMNLVEALTPILSRGDSINVSSCENGNVQMSISIPREIPSELSTFLTSARYPFEPNIPREALKLFLARSVIEAHSWNVDISSERTGSRITFSIPRREGEKIETITENAMDLFIEFICSLLDVNICSIMLSNDRTGELTISSALGLTPEIIRNTIIKKGENIAGWVALTGEPLFITDIEKDARFPRKSIPQYNSKSLISLPLMDGKSVIGVLNVNNKRTSSPFTLSDYYVSSMISRRISRFRSELKSGKYTDDDVRSFINSFENLLTAARHYDKDKSLLTEVVIRMMRISGASEEEVMTGAYAASLYDLGIALIDPSVLQKSALSTEERRSLKAHPINTVDLLHYIESSDEVKKAIIHHHERYDGNGYPDGLKGTEIPLLSRILAVADSYCAMISKRPYRNALQIDVALKEISDAAGTVFDPEITSLLERAVRDGEQSMK